MPGLVSAAAVRALSPSGASTHTRHLPITYLWLDELGNPVGYGTATIRDERASDSGGPRTKTQ